MHRFISISVGSYLDFSVFSFYFVLLLLILKLNAAAKIFFISKANVVYEADYLFFNDEMRNTKSNISGRQVIVA